MANFSRWFNYAKARLDAAIGQGNRELDELEAERESELADKPWLSSSGDTPTFDEAKARIEWQAEQAERAAGGNKATTGGDPQGAGSRSGSGGASGTEASPELPSTPGAQPSGPATTIPAAEITSPEERAAAAEAAAARLEMEERQRESAARLDAIRAELGIDPPEAPPAP